MIHKTGSLNPFYLAKSRYLSVLLEALQRHLVKNIESLTQKERLHAFQDLHTVLWIEL